jgi:hypothetical protein
MRPDDTTQVLIVGAGPVGLTLALDLGQRGVRCTLVERNTTSIQLPKMERCNGRTMEIYRRLRIADAVRAAGLPRPLATPIWRRSSRPAWPIRLRNIAASGAAMAGRDSWRAAWSPTIHDRTPDGARQRAEIARLFDVEQRKVTEIQGIEAGYQYVDSSIIWPESGQRPDPDAAAYTPTTWPGARLPHVWLDDGSALHDRLGSGYTPLRLGRRRVDTSAFVDALRRRRAPLEVLDVPRQRRPRSVRIRPRAGAAGPACRLAE